MKSLLRIAAATVVVISMNLVPAYAASKSSGTARTHTETIHDRTPTVHEHGSHPHHG
jgi:hypothetical protein